MKLTTTYVVVQLRAGRLSLIFNAVIFNSFETARSYAQDMTEAYSTPENELEYVVLRGKDPYND
jgi:hypothetical protein